MTTETSTEIFKLLQAAAVEHDVLEHPPVAGCEDSLALRQAAGWTGASSKCILFHAKGVFHLVATTSERSINARRFKKQFKTKNIRFATPEEVLEQTGCTVGSVPPFVPGAHAVRCYVDGDILAQRYFMFNPADPTRSVRIQSRDLPRLLQAAGVHAVWFTDNGEGSFDFSEEAPSPERGPEDQAG
ncbi:MAG: Ala-tRNA(Pro) deacylase [Desulfovibrionales bacterium]|nr:Ala-tRNA(Pro) deacylase [Desulfovibrionales bacterium]